MQSQLISPQFIRQQQCCRHKLSYSQHWPYLHYMIRLDDPWKNLIFNALVTIVTFQSTTQCTTAPIINWRKHDSGYLCSYKTWAFFSPTHCRSHRGTGAHTPRGPLGAYSVIQNSAKNAPKHVIFTHKKSPKFSEKEQSPLHRPFPVVRGHPSPYPTPQVPPTTTRPRLRHCTNIRFSPIVVVQTLYLYLHVNSIAWNMRARNDRLKTTRCATVPYLWKQHTKYATRVCLPVTFSSSIAYRTRLSKLAYNTSNLWQKYKYLLRAADNII